MVVVKKQCAGWSVLEGGRPAARYPLADLRHTSGVHITRESVETAALELAKREKRKLRILSDEGADKLVEDYRA